MILGRGAVAAHVADVFGASTVDIERFRRGGVTNLDRPILSDGLSVLKEAKGAPHPNAATVVINWYASRPGQETYSRAMNEPSLRTDDRVAGLPPYILPKPGVAYADRYVERRHLGVRPKVQKAIIEALGGR